MERWEREREARTSGSGKRFHDIGWDGGETKDWFEWLYQFAGVAGLYGEGRNPPRLGDEVRWALKHLKKYPNAPGPGDDDEDGGAGDKDESETKLDESIHSEIDNNAVNSVEDWVVVHRRRNGKKDSLGFI